MNAGLIIIQGVVTAITGFLSLVLPTVSGIGVTLVVGSPNFDNRSFRLQFEINALVVNKDFGKQLEAMLENDMAHATPWDPTDLRNAPFTKRLAVSVARLTAPLL